MNVLSSRILLQRSPVKSMKCLMVLSLKRTVSRVATRRCVAHGTSIALTRVHNFLASGGTSVASQNTACRPLFLSIACNASDKDSKGTFNGGALERSRAPSRMEDINFPVRPQGIPKRHQRRHSGRASTPCGTKRIHLRGTPLKQPQTRRELYKVVCQTASSACIIAMSTRPTFIMAVTASRSVGHCTHSTIAVDIASYLFLASATFTGSSRNPGVVPMRSRGLAGQLSPSFSAQHLAAPENAHEKAMASMSRPRPSPSHDRC
mmetsp:Transcript_107541/g.229619  ORF Transcript_107541/g.229619 Transcript_107541/m.229619 type:complete len:263 (+) Transcript_107541:587-1375(+)